MPRCSGCDRDRGVEEFNKCQKNGTQRYCKDCARESHRARTADRRANPPPKPEFKTCGRCGELKPNEAFTVESSKPNGLSFYCKTCESDRKRESLYGVTPERFAEILESQNGACALCLCPEPNGKGAWHVDHCHETGVVRGLLCNNCNLMLGYSRDNPNTHRRAVEYLSSWLPLAR